MTAIGTTTAWEAGLLLGGVAIAVKPPVVGMLLLVGPFGSGPRPGRAAETKQ